MKLLQRAGNVPVAPVRCCGLALLMFTQAPFQLALKLNWACASLSKYRR